MGTPMHENRSERPNSGLNWVKSSLSFSNGNCVEVAGGTYAAVGTKLVGAAAAVRLTGQPIPLH